MSTSTAHFNNRYIRFLKTRRTVTVLYYPLQKLSFLNDTDLPENDKKQEQEQKATFNAAEFKLSMLRSSL